MSWQDAKAEAERLIDTIDLTALSGSILLLPDFEDEADCRFFFPERPLAFHQMILKAAGRSARKAGAKVVHHSVTRKRYLRWLAARDGQDTEALRGHYFCAQVKVIEE